MSSGKLGNCFQKMRMAYAVKAIHPEAQTGQQLALHRQLVNGNDAGYIFLRRAQTAFVAAHQAVGSTIDEDDGIQIEVFNERLVAGQ